MKYILILFSIPIFISCNSGGSKGADQIDSLAQVKYVNNVSYEQVLDSFISTKPKVQPTFLQFVLGATKTETEKRIHSLIKEGKLEDLSSVTFQMINAKAEGYPYDLYVSPNEKIETLLTPDYYEGKLYMVSLFPYGRTGANYTIKDFLVSQYGEPIFSETKGSDNTFYWFRNGYEISFSMAPFSSIEFSDPSIKKEIRNFKNKVDSLEKDLSKQAAKETKKDFQ